MCQYLFSLEKIERGAKLYRRVFVVNLIGLEDNVTFSLCARIKRDPLHPVRMSDRHHLLDKLLPELSAHLP